MKKWSTILLLMQFSIVPQLASATSMNSLKYLVAGNFQAIGDDGASHEAVVTGWLDIDVLHHTIYNVNDPIDDLGHLYNLSYQIDVIVDVGNGWDPLNDLLFSFSGFSNLHLGMMTDIYLNLGGFGNLSTDLGGIGVLSPSEGNGDAWGWHSVEFDLHNLTEVELDSASGYIGDLWTGYKTITFTEASTAPIPEPSTIFLLMIGLIILTLNKGRGGLGASLSDRRSAFVVYK